MQLIQVGKTVDPPVVRLVTNFDQYQQEVEEKLTTRLKAKEEAKEGGLKMKELRFGHRIEEHDVRVKIASLSSFLAKQYRVKVAIEFKNWRDFDAFLATQLLNNILTRVAHLCKPTPAKAAGRYVYCVFEPDAKGSAGMVVEAPKIEASQKRLSEADKQRQQQSKLPMLNEAGQQISAQEAEAMRAQQGDAGEAEEDEDGAPGGGAPRPYDKQRKKTFRAGAKAAPARRSNYRL